MSDTTFQDYVTPIPASWLNDVNDHTYNSTPVAPATTVHPANVIANTPAGNVAATNVQDAINELDTEKATVAAVQTAQATADNHIADTSAAHAASAIANTPAGTIAATDVQAAINELDTEKLASATAASTYAPIAGNSAQTFSVGAATLNTMALRAGQYGSQINGWTYANNAGDATNDIDIAAGSGLDSTRAYFIVGGALTKQSDAAWAVGNNAGMLDTGAVGNNDYYIWAIARSDTGVVDYLSSLSSTAPTMPASYDYKRLIGWFKRVGGAIVAFTTYEGDGGALDFAWKAPTLDVDLANTLTTSRRTDAVKVPLNFSVIAELSVFVIDSTTGRVIIACPDTTDAAPSSSAAPLCNQYAASFGFPTQMRIRTSSTGTIAARSEIASVDAYRVSTVGFTWSRRA